MIASRQHQIVYWLCVCTVLVFLMVIFGGAVRLTGSGLSMVDWKPIMGAIPPLNLSDWQDAFKQYQGSPEYKLVNHSMELSEFKFIFYMEYGHRLLGRLIGLVFILPYIWFLIRGYIPKGLKLKLFLLLCLGAGQGLMGWYMVKSGLVDLPHVSQYRLTAHLLLAVVIYVWMIAIISSLLKWTPISSTTVGRLCKWGLVVVGLIVIMIASGGFMAGSKAGFIYNTWPTMGGEFIPPALWVSELGWKNLFENPSTIQFVHRWLAIIVAVIVVVFAISIRRLNTGDIFNRLALITIFLIVLQLCLGIFTLINQVPVVLGVAHQGGALLVLGIVVIIQSGLKKANGVKHPIT